MFWSGSQAVARKINSVATDERLTEVQRVNQLQQLETEAQQLNNRFTWVRNWQCTVTEVGSLSDIGAKELFGIDPALLGKSGGGPIAVLCNYYGWEMHLFDVGDVKDIQKGSTVHFNAHIKSPHGFPQQFDQTELIKEK